MNMLLTVSEDRTTLRSDLSAGTGVSGKGDAGCIRVVPLSFKGRPHKIGRHIRPAAETGSARPVGFLPSDAQLNAVFGQLFQFFHMVRHDFSSLLLIWFTGSISFITPSYKTFFIRSGPLGR